MHIAAPLLQIDMIRPLRIRHRRIFTVLGVLLPVAFGLGIAARKPTPEMKSVQVGLIEPTVDAILIQHFDDLFAKQPIRVMLLKENGNAGQLAIRCSAPGDFAKPDLLVYWSATSNITDTLPDDAVLLGAFTALRLKLPASASATAGFLILYSLADNEVVDVSRSLRLTDSTP